MVLQRAWVLLAVLLATAGVSFAASPRVAPFEPSERVRAMVANMSLEEKVGQMVQINVLVVMDTGTLRVDKDKVRDLARNYYVGSYLNTPTSQTGPALNATQWLAIIHDIQTIYQEEGRIPMIFGLDSVHGANYVHGATLFPQQIGAAASLNRELVEKMGHITAKDTRAVGIPWTFAPILDLMTQPLWARVYETFGEDPHIISELGVAIINGYQGSPPQLANDTRVAACMKHFIGYGNARTGNDRTTSWIPERQMQQYYAPPFQAAVDAGVATAMESYNDVNGEPMVASHRYLRRLLRDQMGFGGMLVTDWREIKNLHDWHRAVPTAFDAHRVVLERTSVDMSMTPSDTDFFVDTVALVRDGVIDEARIDESATRILALKEALGLLDAPLPDIESPRIATIGSQEDRAVALELARESITLLENKYGLVI